MASVIHGFFYNKKIFNELGLTVPQTREAFFAALDKVKADGRYVPLAVSGSESWVASRARFPEHRPQLLEGEGWSIGVDRGQERFNNPQYVKVFEELARWRDYLGEGARAATTPPPTSCSPRARLPSMRRDPGRLPLHRQGGLRCHAPARGKAGDGCFFTDHTDIGMGMNPASKNKEAAMTFLQWLTTPQFAELYTNSLPGFFSLSNHFFEATNPAAREMMEWRDQCDSTIRVATQILSRGTPKLGDELAEVSQQVLLGTVAPKAAADRLEQGLKGWYAPIRATRARDRSVSVRRACLPSLCRVPSGPNLLHLWCRMDKRLPEQARPSLRQYRCPEPSLQRLLPKWRRRSPANWRGTALMVHHEEREALASRSSSA